MIELIYVKAVQALELVYDDCEDFIGKMDFFPKCLVVDDTGFRLLLFFKVVYVISIAVCINKMGGLMQIEKQY